MNTASQLPWRLPDIFPTRPEGGDYGYLARGKMVGCSREELMEKCSRDQIPAIHLVWTPETPRLVPPAEVPFLFDKIRIRARSRLKLSLWSGIGSSLLWGTMALGSLGHGDATRLFLLPMLFLGILPLIQGAQGLWKLRSYSCEAMAGEVDTVRYATWVATRKVVFTWGLFACLLTVGIAELVGGLERSIEAAGLVKSAVWHGHVWRLLTCAMLHGSVLHFIFNGSALLQLGRVVEVLTHRAYLAIVFVVSALTGSLFSLVILPDVTSIGASGGLMGLIGFLGVLGYYHKASLPPGFLRSILVSIALIAAIGLLAHGLIDNAAHLGGVLAGIALGRALIGRADSLPLSPSRYVVWSGQVAAVAILVTAATSLYKIVR